MEQLFNIKIGERAIKIKCDHLDFLHEIEVGYDFDFTIEYFHTWQNDQLHCLSLGFVYLAWRGAPFIDVKP